MMTRNRSRAGFTLAEILLSMLVFSIAITTILALLARSIETVDEIVMKDEAMRLSSAVEAFMDSLAFDSVYQKFVVEGQPLVVYFYRGDPNGSLRTRSDAEKANFGEDSTPPPYTGLEGRPGEDFILVAKARIPGDPYLAGDIPVKKGNAFRVELTLSSANPVDAASMPPSSATYPAAVLVFDAVFSPDNRNISLAGVDFNTPLGSPPVYEYSFAVRR